MKMRKPRSSSLYSRLLIYFIIIMLIPLFIFMMYWQIVSQRSLTNSIKSQAESQIQMDGRLLQDFLEDYRHKTYEIATDPYLIEVIGKESQERDEIGALYSMLFSTMRDETYKAAAHITSTDGFFRLSTHIYPEEYDLRFYSNEWDSGTILGEFRTRRNYDNRNTLIHIGSYRITDEGHQVFLSLLRPILSQEGEILGYVIIDVFSDALEILPDNPIFTDEILIDTSDWTGVSLRHNNIRGSYSRFPDLLSSDKLQSIYEFGSFQLIGITDTSVFESNTKGLLAGFLFSLTLGLGISFILSAIFSNSISKRLTNMKTTMKYIQDGNLNLYLEETGITDFDELALSFNSMVTRIIFLMQSKAEEAEKLAEAERQALESQLNPHFIFNSLSTIKALAKLHGEDEIYTISLQLGKLLRSSLKNTSSECTLSESLSLAESYLMIQKIRFKDKLDYSLFIESSLVNVETPKLIIQPLVENAVVHGIENMEGDGIITVNIKREGENVLIVVFNNGPAFLAPTDKEGLRKLYEEGHVGLYNIYRRLTLRYGENFEFSILSNSGSGVTITIKLPLEEK